jgi:hypothetical protein
MAWKPEIRIISVDEVHAVFYWCINKALPLFCTAVLLQTPNQHLQRLNYSPLTMWQDVGAGFILGLPVPTDEKP